MWSGFSSEIETIPEMDNGLAADVVACGAASHLRLKLGPAGRVAAWSRWSHVERLLI